MRKAHIKEEKMDKKQSSLSIAIGMACVWMGTHFGPGVASGTQILVYWVKYGIWGTLASILAMGLLGYCIYCAQEGLGSRLDRISS